MAERSERQRQHAAMMFRWHDQVGRDPTAGRQALALRAVSIIRSRVSENCHDAMIDHSWLAQKLSCSRYGLQKALAWLVERGHLTITCRKHIGRPNLYRPVIQEVPTRVGTFGTAAPTANTPQLAPGANPGSERVPTTVGRNSFRSSSRKPSAVADEIEGRKLAKRYGVAFEDWQSLPATYAKFRSGGA
jgi:hypothetical protein